MSPERFHTNKMIQCENLQVVYLCIYMTVIDASSDRLYSSAGGLYVPSQSETSVHGSSFHSANMWDMRLFDSCKQPMVVTENLLLNFNNKNKLTHFILKSHHQVKFHSRGDYLYSINQTTSDTFLLAAPAFFLTLTIVSRLLSCPAETPVALYTPTTVIAVPLGCHQITIHTWCRYSATREIRGPVHISSAVHTVVAGQCTAYHHVCDCITHCIVPVCLSEKVTTVLVSNA